MSVYVDDMQAKYGRMKLCHMLADTTDELLAMADRIGVERRWLQDAGTPREHFDIALSKRALAIAAGAKLVGPRDLALVMRRKKDALLSEIETGRPIAQEQEKDNASAILSAARTVYDTFVADEAQGYRSRDRQFAIEILGSALKTLDVAETEPRLTSQGRRSCGAPHRDGKRSCDKPEGHLGEHWTYGGDTSTWPQVGSGTQAPPAHPNGTSGGAVAGEGSSTT